MKHSSHLARRGSCWRRRCGRAIECRQGIADEIEGPLDLAVPQTPADVLHGIGETGAFLAVFIRNVRPAFDHLRDMLNAHRKMEPVEHVTGRTEARRLAQRPRPVGTVAQNGDFPWTGSHQGCAAHRAAAALAGQPRPARC